MPDHVLLAAVLDDPAAWPVFADHLEDSGHPEHAALVRRLVMVRWEFIDTQPRLHVYGRDPLLASVTRQTNGEWRWWANTCWPCRGDEPSASLAMRRAIRALLTHVDEPTCVCRLSVRLSR